MPRPDKDFNGIVGVAELAGFLKYMVSERTYSVMYNHTHFYVRSHQIRHQAASKQGSYLGYCRWPLYSSSGVCVYVWVNILITPKGKGYCMDSEL